MPHPAANRCAALCASPAPVLYCKHAPDAAEGDDDFHAGPSDEEQGLSGDSGSDASGSDEGEEAGGSGSEDEEEDDFGSGEFATGSAHAAAPAAAACRLPPAGFGPAPRTRMPLVFVCERTVFVGNCVCLPSA